MTFDQLKQEALIQFALHGYEGASLASIAKEVGIKKQSIYTHFEKKEDLFISTYKDAIEREIMFVEQFIIANKSISLKEILHSFIIEYLKQYENNENTRFFLRTSFFPPMQLKEIVKSGTDQYVNKLEFIIQALFEEKSDGLKSAINAETAGMAYLTMLDGLFVELLYGSPDRLERRTNAAWDIYWRGITEKGE